MLWACFAFSDTGNLQRVEAKMGSIKYEEILEGTVSPSVRKTKLSHSIKTFKKDSNP